MGNKKVSLTKHARMCVCVIMYAAGMAFGMDGWNMDGTFNLTRGISWSELGVGGDMAGFFPFTRHGHKGSGGAECMYYLFILGIGTASGAAKCFFQPFLQS